MNQNNKQSITSYSSKFEQWLYGTPSGRDMLVRERSFYSKSAERLFGLYSLQIGLPTIALLQGNKIVNHYSIPNDIECDCFFLPFAENSIDLIVAPHILEFSQNHNAILSELYRILSPNGTILITCFNKHSWLSLFKKKITCLNKAHLISIDALKDELAELNFAIVGGKFMSYCPPFKNPANYLRYNWLNKAGDRWFPTLANCFGLVLTKKTTTFTPTIAKNENITKSKDMKIRPICKN